MIDDEEYQRAEKVEESLTELINRRHARGVSTEPDITAMLDQRAEKKRRRRRAENLDQWRQFHEDLADSMRRFADEQQHKADRLRDAEETSL